MRSIWQRLTDALRGVWEWTDPDRGLARLPDGGVTEAGESAVELPWRYRWDHLPKRSAGFGFTPRDYREARRRAEEFARSTPGENLWARLRRNGFLDVRSQCYPGVTYRLRVGQRIEVRTGPGVLPPWRHPYLCIIPTYPLPELEFFAHLYLYVRDREDEVIRVAAPQ